jgi:hypothetical protein
MSSSLVFLVAAIIIVGALLFFMISVTSNKPRELDQQEYQANWLTIEHSLNKDDEKTYGSSIMEADKLLDKAMIDLGFYGKTFGERLKKNGQRFSSLNSLWYAHKLRNSLAHEHGFAVNYEQAKRALSNFKQALKDLGAI